MTIITEYFETYREASRHLRNVYYRPVGDDAWDILDEFYEVDILLFKHLVCGPLGISYEQFDWLKAPATVFTLQALGSRLPIMINRTPGETSGYWDNEVKSVAPGDLSLVFISYFDWDPRGTIDHRYIMAKIVDASSSKQVIGHAALVESIHVDIIHTLGKR